MFLHITVCSQYGNNTVKTQQKKENYAGHTKQTKLSGNAKRMREHFTLSQGILISS